MKPKAYVIHLKRATLRRPQAEALLGLLPMPTKLLLAVDGRQMTAAEMRSVLAERPLSPRYPVPLRPTEIACFLSHRQAWQAILDDGCDAGLIVADDVAPAALNFTAVIEAAIATIAPHEFIRFPLRERGDRANVARTHDGTTQLESWLPGLGMQMQWIHGARVLSARPVVIREINFLLRGSVIQNKRMGFVAKLSWEVARPLHRLAMRTANDQRRHRAA